MLPRDKVKQCKRPETVYEVFCDAGLKAKRLRDEEMAYDQDTPEDDPDRVPMEPVKVITDNLIIETEADQ